MNRQEIAPVVKELNMLLGYLNVYVKNLKIVHAHLQETNFFNIKDQVIRMFLDGSEKINIIERRINILGFDPDFQIELQEPKYLTYDPGLNNKNLLLMGEVLEDLERIEGQNKNTLNQAIDVGDEITIFMIDSFIDAFSRYQVELSNYIHFATVMDGLTKSSVSLN